MIDMMQRRSALGLCEICQRRPATRKAQFNAQYLQTTSAALFEEEAMAAVAVEKRVCDECLNELQNAKNVTDLTFERL
jgi:hypothetical protein